MVFALDNDDGTLSAFPSADEAIAHCKSVDVDDGFWRFFDEDGSPLEARFEYPAELRNAGVVSSTYALQRAMSGRWLQERLDEVASMRGCGLATTEDLVETLKINRGKRVERDSRL